MNLSVITVTWNCRALLEKTISSLGRQGGRFEWIVIDGGSKDGTYELAEGQPFFARGVSEPDEGIYDAMNKGLALAQGDGVLFLNAGDTLEGDVLARVSSVPCLIPVVTEDVFGRRREMKPKSQWLGMPYCHQGFIFPRSGLRYDLKFCLAADYDYLLRHSFIRPLSLCCPTTAGYVFYDNKGISAQKWFLRDRESVLIIHRHFGLLRAAIFAAYAFSKAGIKGLLGQLAR